MDINMPSASPQQWVGSSRRQRHLLSRASKITIVIFNHKISRLSLHKTIPISSPIILVAIDFYLLFWGLAKCT